MPIHRSSADGVLGEVRQQDMERTMADAGLHPHRSNTDEKDLSCFKIEPTTRRSSFADMSRSIPGRGRAAKHDI
jgi:hypothetical protein